MQITKIDASACKFLRDHIDEALSKMASELGLIAKTGHASYDANTVDFKVKISLLGHDPIKADFDNYCIAFGLTPDDYGKEFSFRLKKWTLVGIKIRATKYPIIAERNGSRWKLPREAVAELKAANTS